MEKFIPYINGEWVKSENSAGTFDLVSPITEEIITTYALGSKQDVDKAVVAANKAFESFSKTSKEERIALLERIVAQLEKRKHEMADVILQEMGAPHWVGQADFGIGQAKTAIEILKNYPFVVDSLSKISQIQKVPIGVCGIITPWNWPASMITVGVIPALAVGCTVVLKPSEYTPLSAQLMSQIFHDAGVPKGVFNMVYGSGEIVGSAISSHPDIACVSFTGSTRAGIAVATDAAKTVKRVLQELGGKSPNIILPSANIKESVKQGFKSLVSNSGQSCNAPSRMLVPKESLDLVKEALLELEKELVVGNPADDLVYLGPVVNKIQFQKIQDYIQSGLDEGATAVIGGVGRPSHLEKGYFIKPTAFIHTHPDMKIVKEEIFGPVMVVQTYETPEQAVQLANNTPYGLAAYVQGKDLEQVKAIAEQLRAGQVYLNGAFDPTAPFGGFKQSGNGRNWGTTGFDEYLEYRAMVGFYETN